MASGSTKSWTKIKVLSREVKLTYLQSVQVTQGDQNAGTLAGEGGGVGSTSGGTSTPGNPGFLGLYFLGGSPAKSSSFAASDTGWVVSRTWKETSFDKVRYSIGIRDIGISHYKFAPVSEFVSVLFKSPKEIYKVQIQAIEKIPSIYPLDRRYVEYYVTSDEGNTWHRINPLDQPTIVDADGQVVPYTLTFNPEIGGPADELMKFVKTDAPVFGLRYRVVIRGAQDIEDPERNTPLLKRIRMRMYPKGGLSQ